MRTGIHAVTKEVRRQAIVKRKGLTKAEKLVKSIDVHGKLEAVCKGVVSLVYKDEILQYNHFLCKGHRDELINRWSKIYAFNQPKQHPLYIQIKLKNNVTICNARDTEKKKTMVAGRSADRRHHKERSVKVL